MQPLEIIFYLFISTATLLLLYNIVSAVVIGFYKYKYASHNQGVSVVVSSHFEYENLQALIPALLEQKHEPLEIIIVDDRSEDGTFDYINEQSSLHEQLRVVRIDHTPDHISDKKYALTLGIKAAQNDIILLTDADCVPVSNEWVTIMTTPFADENIKLVIGTSVYHKEKNLTNLITRIETLYTAHNYVFFGFMGNPYMGVGRNLGMRKSFFMEKNGYGKYQGLVGGDDDLFVNEHANKSNTKIVLKPTATTLSKAKKTWHEYVTQKVRHMSVGKHYRLMDKLLLGFFILLKVVFWIAFFIAIVAEYNVIETLTGFISVLVSLLITLYVLKRKVGERTKLWLLPILDIIYLICYLSIGMKVKSTKKVKWR